LVTLNVLVIIELEPPRVATVFEVKSNLTVSNLLIALTVILVHLENLSKALYDCQILLQGCQAHIREVVNAEEKIKDNC
jgi:hypothetical protein